MSQTEAEGPRNKPSSGWSFRHQALTMNEGGRNEVKEFTGMWPLEPDADLEAFTAKLAPGGWDPPELTFSQATTMLGLIRTARWFVARTHGTDGYSLFFVTQFDGSLDKYLDDFVLNGKENLSKIWGPCVGCPSGPDATAEDIVDYIARGQIKTLACYDVFPSLSLSQIYKAADWYDKTQRFQRAVAKGDGNLEDLVNGYFKELAEQYTEVLSDAVIDTDVGHRWQLEDIPEYPSR